MNSLISNTRIHFTDTMLQETNQTRKSTYCGIVLTEYSEKENYSENKQQSFALGVWGGPIEKKHGGTS